jgi:hypothetical protein
MTAICKRLKGVRTRIEMNTYLASEACGVAWGGLNARDRQTVAEAIGRTWTRLDALAPLPAPRTVTTKWDAQRVARLRQVAPRCHYNSEVVARELAITERAASRAIYRYIGRPSALAA